MLIDLAWGLAYDAVGDNHSADTEAPCLKIEFMNGKLLRQVLDKMMKSPTCSKC
jgi:hypothetical protein